MNKLIFDCVKRITGKGDVVHAVLHKCLQAHAVENKDSSIQRKHLLIVVVGVPIIGAALHLWWRVGDDTVS